MDRRKKGEYVGALGALLVHVAVIALLILVSFTVPQPDEDAGGVPVMLGNVDTASGFDDPSLVDVDIMDEDAAAPPAETEPQLPSEQDLLTQTEEETVTLKPKTEEPKKETVKPKEVVKPKEPVKKPEKTHRTPSFWQLLRQPYVHVPLFLLPVVSLLQLFPLPFFPASSPVLSA